MGRTGCLLEAEHHRPLLLSVFVCLLAVLFVGSFTLYASAQEISARLSPQKFTTEQPATLTITITGQQSADLMIPEVDGLIFHRRGQSSQFQMINGAVSSSITYTYLVQALKPGDYTIPAIAAKLKKGTFSSAPITCSVSAAASPKQQQSSTSSPPGQAAPSEVDKFAFITLSPKKTTAYVGEIVPTIIKAYFLRGIKVNLNSLPSLKGESILLSSLSNEPEQHDEVVNDTSYTVLTWDTALTPIKEGAHDLSMEMDATLLVKSSQRQRVPGFGGRMFQDDLFDDFFARYENRPVKVSSPIIAFSASTLPESGKPAGYSGAVGNFSLKTSAQPTEIDAGEPVTLTMTISGVGNFDSVSAPALTESIGLKTYTPTVSFDQGIQPNQGDKSFEQAVVVTDSSIKQLPPAVFSFFDPDKNSYQTVFSDPIPLTVKSSPPAARPLTASDSVAKRNDESRAAAQSSASLLALAPIKLELGKVTKEIKPFFMKQWFILFGAFCVLMICAVSGYRIRSQFLVGHPEISFKKNIVHKRRELENTLVSAKSMSNSDYLGYLPPHISTFLALIWQVEPTSLTTADIQRRLGPDSAITELFARADEARYGAITLSAEDRNNLHTRITEKIASLC